MEEIKQANEWLNDIMQGRKKADNAPEIVQNWLKLTIYNLAHGVVHQPTKIARAEAMQKVKSQHPLFHDDVSQLAKLIWSEQLKR